MHCKSLWAKASAKWLHKQCVLVLFNCVLFVRCNPSCCFNTTHSVWTPLLLCFTHRTCAKTKWLCKSSDPNRRSSTDNSRHFSWDIFTLARAIAAGAYFFLFDIWCSPWVEHAGVEMMSGPHKSLIISCSAGKRFCGVWLHSSFSSHPETSPWKEMVCSCVMGDGPVIIRIKSNSVTYDWCSACFLPFRCIKCIINHCL